MDIQVMEVIAQMCEHDAINLMRSYHDSRVTRLDELPSCIDVVDSAVKLFTAADQMRSLANRKSR